VSSDEPRLRPIAAPVMPSSVVICTTVQSRCVIVFHLNRIGFSRGTRLRHVVISTAFVMAHSLVLQSG
jgi:hypothetical protein